MNKFDERAKDWDKKRTTLDRTEACIENIKKNIDLNKIRNILEYGCGTGLLSFSLKNDSNEVLGLDSSIGMVEEFNNKVKEQNLTNIKAFKHDIQNDELSENCFDLIIISMSLHHIEDLDIFFKKAYKALKEGGILCINDLEKEDGSFHKKYNNEGVFHFGFSQEELENISLKFGLKEFKYERVFVFKRDYGDFPLFNFYAVKV
ncbi:Demethylmenaquinone methyltransferase [Aliarcobacter thereius]|uniref:Class I SAM-dependent methyltransferase n=1 Tax=Aliarcobacter thereius TaxID=544718 RepID=A0A1C0B6T5_9BACT|nr:class I SAM-dependent methyltransferase [Aliarcobacter thereius]OCL91181.1 Demethylmenaquinone methyltransferase [Aliarcobacter thereius]OCL99297.1 Demethylmenaquinone methyltransferase [Aliarcobacter thereius]TLS71878.1 class I SAM-dependent methyltransferase [Aliarcobacter thereius]